MDIDESFVKSEKKIKNKDVEAALASILPSITKRSGQRSLTLGMIRPSGPKAPKITPDSKIRPILTKFLTKFFVRKARKQMPVLHFSRITVVINPKSGREGFKTLKAGAASLHAIAWSGGRLNEPLWTFGDFLAADGGSSELLDVHHKAFWLLVSSFAIMLFVSRS